MVSKASLGFFIWSLGHLYVALFPCVGKGVVRACIYIAVLRESRYFGRSRRGVCVRVCHQYSWCSPLLSSQQLSWLENSIMCIKEIYGQCIFFPYILESFYLGWFNRRDGFRVGFFCFVLLFCFCFGCGVGFLFGLVLFFNPILWLCTYSGRNGSWRRKSYCVKKINPESFLNVSCYEKDNVIGHNYADFFSPHENRIKKP